MAQLILPVQPSQLPSGFCPSNYQDLLNNFSANQTVTFPTTFTGVTVSAAKPVDTSQAWLKLDTLGRPTRFYYFAQGAWLAAHPDFPGKTIIWTGVLPDFTIFDGGDSSVPSPLSGPMWQLAKDKNGNVIEAKFLIAAGTLPSSTILAVGDTGGEEKHTLLLKETPPHTHDFTVNAFNTDAAGSGVLTGGNDNASTPRPDGSFNGTTVSTGGDGTPAAALPFNEMPPYLTVYYLQRTNRLYYAIN